MKIKKSTKIFYKILMLLVIVMVSFGFLEDDQKGTKRPQPLYKQSSVQTSGKQGDAYVMNVNNIYLPLNSKGIIAAVQVGNQPSSGRFGGNSFLFSSGFFLSGFANGQLWANAVASATLVEDYESGRVNPAPDDDDQLYVLNSQDPAFGPSWQDWIDAVKLGADFYDGDGNGVYEPIDKNDNGEWDPDEDRPDLVGDEMVWCVYNDGIPSSQRRWNTVPPYGIEIRQSVFAFASAGAIGNLVFVRYRFNYVGLGNAGEPEKMTDVYFGVWADPDVGQYDNDVVGSDVERNAGYTYDNGPDDIFGNQPPCFMIDFFSGPRSYIPGETFVDVNGDNVYTPGVDTPLDTAYSVQGQIKGVAEYPGAKNMPVSSFVLYINGDPNLNDPSIKEEARNYITGLDRTGNIPDPCVFPYGAVLGGVDCSTVDPRFWFSGDPVTNVGWIATINEDVRQMTNTGPFELVKGEENEIVVAYVVGQGVNPLNSITVARAIDDGAQNIFDLNFLAPSPPPPTTPTITSSDDLIEILWDTPDQVSYVNTTPTWDLHFYQYQVWAFATNSNVNVVNNQTNAQLIATYQLDNFIRNIYKQDGVTGGIELLYVKPQSNNLLNQQVYSDPVTGRLKLNVIKDPFKTTTPITKGTPYYFAIVGVAINFDALIYKEDPTMPVGTVGDYYLTKDSFVQEVENIRVITPIVAGEQLYDPPEIPLTADHVSGATNGNMAYDIVDKSALSGNQYEVTFFPDSSTQLYSTFWRLTNTSQNNLVLDSAKYYLFGTGIVSVPPTEGFIVQLSNEAAEVDTELVYHLNQSWIDTTTSVFNYLTQDIKYASHIKNIGGNLSNLWGNYTTADRLRRVEIRFGETQKAYRYLNGFIGPNASVKRRTFKYAEAVTPADTAGKGPVGMWDTTNDRAMGIVDVPFQVWVDDPNFSDNENENGVNEGMRQLTVGFVEKSTDLGGHPDGIWNPDSIIEFSGEYLFIFDEVYDPNMNQAIYKGSTYIDPGADWADINGAATSNGAFYFIPDGANISQDDRNKANSPFFNTLYAVGIVTKSADPNYTAGDELILGVDNYGYTEYDAYVFMTRKEGALSSDQEQDLWNKVNVFPNPLYGFNTLTGYDGTAPDDPWVTFTNLPTDITIRIYSLSGLLLRTLTTSDKSDPDSPFLKWDLLNENGLRAASGMYLAIVSSPTFGDKVLKFSIIMPQKQIPRY